MSKMRKRASNSQAFSIHMENPIQSAATTPKRIQRVVLMPEVRALRLSENLDNKAFSLSEAEMLVLLVMIEG